MESFNLAFSAIFPVLLMMTIGALVRHFKIISENGVTEMNRLIFRLLLPMLMFLNSYNMDLSVLNEKMALANIFLIAALCITTFLLIMFMPKYISAPEKCGVAIQGVFRSNCAIAALSIYISVYGDSDTGVISILIAIVVPTINALSVIVLETFRGSRSNPAEIFKQVLKNPIIQASVSGMLLNMLRITIPPILYSTAESISKLPTPLAFIVLGASLNFLNLKKNYFELIIISAGKLIILPFIIVYLSYIFGLRKQILFAIMICMSAPTSISSFPMAKEMGGDSELAAQIVAVTSLLSIITLFFWIFFFKYFSLI